MKSYQQLKKIFKRISHLQYVHRILMWDEAVMMPVGAQNWRRESIATLNRTMQSIISSKKVKSLLEKAKEAELTNWDQANLALIEKKIKSETCIPKKLKERSIKASLSSEQNWRKLRAQNNWPDFLPYFNQSFEYVKEIALRQSEVFGLDPYDCLIDQYAAGFNQKNIDLIFSSLKNILPQFIEKIIEKQKQEIIENPRPPFSPDQQKKLGLNLMQTLLFDFNRGRLDVSHHPFCSGGTMDVRITSRYRENEFLSSLFAICHETGHALYEQGMPQEWIDQPVGRVDNMAMHESQSLLIEMDVCRSYPFFEYLTPLIREYFGEQNAFTANNLFHFVTRVKKSWIRVDADEVTYPLHVILRYELEKALFKGEIALSELPHHWNEAMMKYLQISTKGNDKDGVMQDVHWAAGIFGYFPAYTLGRMIAAQLFASFTKAHPTFSEDLKSGKITVLHNWLSKNVYVNASSLSISDWLQKETKQDLNTQFYLDHIKKRYLD